MSKPDRNRRSNCPVSSTLDLLGDKWTLLIIRDIFFGKKTYGEFLDSPEGIPTNILADRLKRLVENGIIAKTPYQHRPIRYEYALTIKGEALGPILNAMVKWGEVHIPGSKVVQKK